MMDHQTQRQRRRRSSRGAGPLPPPPGNPQPASLLDQIRSRPTLKKAETNTASDNSGGKIGVSEPAPMSFLDQIKSRPQLKKVGAHGKETAKCAVPRRISSTKSRKVSRCITWTRMQIRTKKGDDADTTTSSSTNSGGNNMMAEL